MTSGDNAYRELRSTGPHNVWLCQMGRQAVDGSYEEFKRKVRAAPVEFDDLAVRYSSLRGDEIAFGWQGPLLVNGKNSRSPVSSIMSPYCVADLPATEMEIKFRDTAMRLNTAIEGRASAVGVGAGFVGVPAAASVAVAGGSSLARW